MAGGVVSAARLEGVEARQAAAMARKHCKNFTVLWDDPIYTSTAAVWEHILAKITS
jgi:hypothetical protein